MAEHPQRIGIIWEMTASKMINENHDIVLSDRRIKLLKRVEATGQSRSVVFLILHEMKIGNKGALSALVKNKSEIVVDSEKISSSQS